VATTAPSGTQSTASEASGERVEVSAQHPRDSHPRFLDAVLADARVAAAFRGERHQFRSRLDGMVQALRLMLVTDAFLGQCAYRLKARLQALRIPVLPWLAHRIAMMTAQITISDAAVLKPGVFIPHGQVVIQGMVTIHSRAILFPWITIGLIGTSIVGPTIGPRASIGTGAKVLGPISVGKDARVGANSVVLNDVPPDTTVVGAPAKQISD
jgi:serine O-acetyltransferase